MKNFNKCLNMCASIGSIPSSYVDSLSYEEQILWICNFLKTKILPAIEDIPSYVDDKIEEMAESGELEQIIEKYINLKTLVAFDKVSDMKVSNKLINGSFAKTLGYYNVNDGGSALYKIRTVTSQDVVDESLILSLNDPTLVAELIKSDVYLNVLQAGVKTGVNQSAKLQSLINNGHYDLYFPGGYYIFNIVLDSHQFLIKGDGIDRTIFTSDNDTKAVISIDLTNGDNLYSELNDFYIYTQYNKPNSNAIEVIGSNHALRCFKMDTVSCVGYKNGLYIDANTDFYTNSINNCNFSNNSDNGIRKPQGSGYFNLNCFTNCRIIGNVNYGIALETYIGRGQTNSFISCDIEQNSNDYLTYTSTAQYSVSLNGLTNTTFTSCYFEKNGENNSSYVSTVFIYNTGDKIIPVNFDSCNFTLEKNCVTTSTKNIHVSFNNCNQNDVEGTDYKLINLTNLSPTCLFYINNCSYNGDLTTNSNIFINGVKQVNVISWSEPNATSYYKINGGSYCILEFAASYSNNIYQYAKLYIAGNELFEIQNIKNSESNINFTFSYDSTSRVLTMVSHGNVGVVYTINEN